LARAIDITRRSEDEDIDVDDGRHTLNNNQLVGLGV
jgi:hypothetical protein